MNKRARILTGILSFIMLAPGLAKFREPFKTLIYKYLTLIGFPLPDVMQYVVKFSEVSVGLAMLFLTFKVHNISQGLRDIVFYLTNFTIIIMMIVAVYTHMDPNVPAAILPMEFKPPIMPISYILLVFINLYLYRKS
jgi:hypothetical protein